MTGSVRHPIFARLLHRTSASTEREVGPLRDELLAGLAGRVVEVGAGNGIGFSHYPRTVESVIAIEPEPYLRAKAGARAAAAAVPVDVRDGVAEALPLEDASVDAAVVSLVLCSVRDPHVAIAELRRVLRPGGEIRVFEHVRASRPAKARLQRALDRSGVWPLLAGGCHCGRDTVAELEHGGMRVERVRTLSVGPSWAHTNPHVLGRALAPG